LKRRRQRETALQVLFQAEVARISGERAFARTMELFGLNTEDFAYAQELVDGVLAKVDRLDRIISRVSHEWRLERMANVDRNIIRLALYEVFFRDDIPINVAVNEALELARTFGTEDSRRFVNGILGKVVEEPEEYRPE